VGTFSTSDTTSGYLHLFADSNPGNLFAISGAKLIVAERLITRPPQPTRLPCASPIRVEQRTTITQRSKYGRSGCRHLRQQRDDAIDSTSTVAGQPYPTSEEDNINAETAMTVISGLDGSDTLSARWERTRSRGLGDDKLLAGGE